MLYADFGDWLRQQRTSLEPWQADFLSRIWNADQREIRLWTGRGGKRFAHRCLVEDMLAHAIETEARGDDLFVRLDCGSSVLLVGATRLLIDDLLAEAERALPPA